MSSLKDNLTLPLAAAYFGINALDLCTLPEVATRALSEGMDSPSLRELAKAGGRAANEIGDLFERSLSELQIEVPHPSAASLTIALEYARLIAARELHPVEGARLIAAEAVEHYDEWDELKIFGGLESLHDGASSFTERNQYEAQIIEEAHRLLRFAF